MSFCLESRPRNSHAYVVCTRLAAAWVSYCVFVCCRFAAAAVCRYLSVTCVAWTLTLLIVVVSTFVTVDIAKLAPKPKHQAQ